MAVGKDALHGYERPKKFVRIPDMFASIMSVEPRVNPHYEKVKPEAEAWVNKILGLNEKQARRNAKADFAYMAALWVPEADEESYRIVVDYLHWIFYFDDQFDEGHLKDDLEGAKAEVEATFAVMDEDHPTITPDENPLRYIFQYTYRCFQKRASPGLQARYRESQREYFDAVVRQITVHTESIMSGVDEYMDYRRLTIGLFPCNELVEYAQEIELPQYVIDHHSIVELRRVSADITLLQNDVLSYRKDLIQGVEHNIIHVHRRKGFSEQQALDAVGGMFNTLFKDWYLTLAEIPSWGERVDREVLKYIGGCRDLAIGNLYWSFMTGRYLGQEGEVVRKTRIMALP